MSADASGALIWVEDAGTYRYAIVSIDGHVWNWATGAWDAMPASPLPGHLRPMARVSFGPSTWSQDVVPPMAPHDGQLTAVVYTVDASGKPTGFRALADLTGTRATFTICPSPR